MVKKKKKDSLQFHASKALFWTYTFTSWNDESQIFESQGLIRTDTINERYMTVPEVFKENKRVLRCH